MYFTAKSYHQRVSLLVVLLVVPCLAGGCYSDDEIGLPAPASPFTVQRLRLDAIVTAMGVTGRSVLDCPAGKCILLHYPPVELEAPELSAVLESDPASSEDDGELFEEDGNRWCSAAAKGANLSTFNCCTFAVGDIVGLTPADWVNPVASGNTDDTNPMEILLDSYFQCVKVYPGPTVNWQAIERDQDLHVHDVLCFVQVEPSASQFVHVGKVLPNKGINWLVSKFGCGPLVKASIAATGEHFSGHWTEVRVYRSKGKSI
jgi:hypothetical protein